MILEGTLEPRTIVKGVPTEEGFATHACGGIEVDANRSFAAHETLFVVVGFGLGFSTHFQVWFSV